MTKGSQREFILIARTIYNKYFTYDDKLQRVVSKVTGILILLYNLLAGMLLIHIFVRYAIGFNAPAVLLIAVYLVPSAVAAFILILLNNWILSLLTRGTEVEEYSYIRLMLFSTLIIYIVIILFFVTLILLNLIPGNLNFKTLFS